MKDKFLRTKVSLAYYAIVLVILFFPIIVVAQEPTEYVGATLTSARLFSLVLIAIGFLSVIIALRSKNLAEGNRRKMGLIIGLVMGLIAVVLSGISISINTGFGTGGGKAGAILAILIGVLGVCLTTRTFIRIRDNSQSKAHKSRSKWN